MEGTERNTNGRRDEFMILIGTPAYNGMVHIDYLKSILGLSGVIPFEVMNIGNESLITRARNKIVNYFYYNPKYTHLLFIDGDIEVSPVDIVRLLSHNKHAIGAAVPMKGMTADGQLIYNVNEPVLVEGNLYTVKHVGTAVFMLSRFAVEQLCENSPRYMDNGVYQHDVFRVGVVDGAYLSEDYFVCNELQKLGFAVYVDDSIITHHQGMIKL